LFEPPVTASTTEAPLIGLPPASLAVTVIVEVPLPATIDVGAAETVDCEADTAGAPLPAAWISMPKTPAFKRLAQLASIVLSLTTHSASSAEDSPEVCSAISAKPLPGVTAGPLPLTPTTPKATLLGFPKAPSETVRAFDPSLRFEPACPMAPAPFTPPVSTPLHCDTIHWALETLLANVIVIGALPGAGLIARKTVSRLRGALITSKSTLVTVLQLVMPPPDSVGLMAVELRWLNTATVMSALGAGEMAAVAYTFWFTALLPDASSVWVIVAPEPGGVTLTVAVWVIAVPLIVAETVLVSATVEPSDPVATPLAFVGPAGWVRVFPLPVDARITVAPLIGFPKPSLAVTVMVEAPPPAMIDIGEAEIVDCEADKGPEVTVTVAV